MEQIIQLIYLLVTVALMATAFYFGYSFGKKERREPPKVSDEQRRQAEKMGKAFQELMSYDVSTAMQRRVRDA